MVNCVGYTSPNAHAVYMFPTYSLTGWVGTVAGHIYEKHYLPTNDGLDLFNGVGGGSTYNRRNGIDSFTGAVTDTIKNTFGAAGFGPGQTWKTWRTMHVPPFIEIFLLLSNITVLTFAIMFLLSLFNDDMDKPYRRFHSQAYMWVHLCNPGLIIKLGYLIYPLVDQDTWGFGSLIVVWIITFLWFLFNGLAAMMYSKAQRKKNPTYDSMQPQMDQEYYYDQNPPPPPPPPPAATPSRTSRVSRPK